MSAAITLSALAAVLGEIEPADRDADLSSQHEVRLEALAAVARFLPVRTAQDAAFALSVAAAMLSEIHGTEQTEYEKEACAQRGQEAIRQVCLWLITEYGARPLERCWVQAEPFGDKPAAPS